MLKSLWLCIQVSRPAFWFYAPLAFCSGLIFSQLGSHDPGSLFTPAIIFQIFSLSFPCALFTFGINDIHDHETDRINPRKKRFKHLFSFLEGVKLNQENHTVIKKGIIASGLFIAAASLLTRNPGNMFYTGSLLVLTFSYSAPPWRLKSKPPLDSVSAGLAASLLPFAMGYCHGGSPWDLPLQIYVFSICAMGVHSISTIMDYRADLESGTTTFAVRYGRKSAALFPAVAFTIALLILQTRLLRCFTITCIIMFTLNLIFPSEKLARATFISLYAAVIIVSFAWIIYHL